MIHLKLSNMQPKQVGNSVEIDDCILIHLASCFIKICFTHMEGVDMRKAFYKCSKGVRGNINRIRSLFSCKVLSWISQLSSSSKLFSRMMLISSSLSSTPPKLENAHINSNSRIAN
jgi:hypothetical protein